MVRLPKACWSAVALPLVLLAGCQGTPPRPDTGAQPGPTEPSRGAARRGEGPPEIDRLAQAHAHYGTALIHDLSGEPAAALEHFQAAALDDPQNAGLTLEATRRFLQANQPESALALLTNATARPEASGELFAELGAVYAQLGKTDSAIAADKTAIRRSPHSLAGYRNLFTICFQNKRYDEAQKVLDQAAKPSGTTADFLVEVARLYVGLGQQVTAKKEAAQASALATLERAAKLKPTDPDVRLKLADGFNALGHPEKASPLYLDLLREYPDSPLVRTAVRAKLIDIYMQGKDPSRAAEQLEAVVRDEPSNALAYYLLGNLAYEGKKMDQAADYLAKAILFKPDLEPAYYDLAQAQIASDHAAAALETLRKARTKFGDSFVTEFLTGVAYRADKQYAQAIQAFTAAEIIAQATDPKRLNEFFYFQAATAYERKGELPQAVQYLEKTIQLAPDFAEALNYLGYLWADRGENLDRARELIEKAVKLEPKNAAYLDSLGWVLFKQGHPQEALSYLQQAIALSEEPDPTLFDHLGDTLAALNQPDKAREAWRRSLALQPDEKIQRKLAPPASK